MLIERLRKFIQRCRPLDQSSGRNRAHEETIMIQWTEMTLKEAFLLEEIAATAEMIMIAITIEDNKTMKMNLMIESIEEAVIKIK
jgi:hypothetical protein